MIKRYFATTLLYIFAGVSCGLVCGGVCTIFALVTSLCDQCFHSNPWLIFLLPLTGIFIVLLYDYFRRDDDLGMDALFKFSHRNSDDIVSPWLSPLIITSTCLGYLTGGSLGRVGSALQVGGGLGSLIYNLSYGFSDADRRNLFLACGFSAAFTAMLDAPLAGAFFGVEVLILTGAELLAIFPSLISAFITWWITGIAGVQYVDLHMDFSPVFSAEFFLKLLIVAFASTLASRLYCYGRRVFALGLGLISNKIARVLLGTGLIIAITLLLGETYCNGIGFSYVRQILDGDCDRLAFLWKLILTCLTLGCGIRGGDISPTIFVGASSCYFVGSLIGFNPSLAAAVGIVGTLASDTKCPVSICLLGFEMLCFNVEAGICFLITALIAHLLSGTYGLYREQHCENQLLKFRTFGI